MNTKTKKISLEYLGKETIDDASVYVCILKIESENHKIVLTTNTIYSDGITQALIDNPEHEDFFEFMESDCSIEVANQDDINAIAAVINNIDYLNSELAELNIQELAFAVSHAQEAILDGSGV